jgi:hypothetical protein
MNLSTNAHQGVDMAARRMNGGAGGAPRPPAGDPGLDLITEHLRTVFREVEQEELPDRFKDLLRRLADEESGK